MKKKHGILVLASVSALVFATPVFAAEIPYDFTLETNIDSNYEMLPDELIGTASAITPDTQPASPSLPDPNMPQTRPALPDQDMPQTRPTLPDTTTPDTQPASPYIPPDTQPARPNRPGRPGRPNRPGRPGVNRPAQPGNANTPNNAVTPGGTNASNNANVLDPYTGRTRELLKATAVPGQTDVYYVRAGDTLWKIARKYMTVLETVIKANPSLSNPDLIYPGDQIAVPLR
jgi:spore coat assembly protein SafA